MTIEVLTLVALTASFFALAWQGKEVAAATRFASKASVESTMAHLAANFGAVMQLLVTYPELRRYVYEGEPLPESGNDLARVQTLCELLCDAAETTLVVAARMPHAATDLQGWARYARSILDSSPGCASIVERYPHWYPMLSNV